MTATEMDSIEAVSASTSTGNETAHGRDGSRAIFTGRTWRSCTCGAEFVGTADESFTAREAHIAEASR
jgi:hypothetical protein